MPLLAAPFAGSLEHQLLRLDRPVVRAEDQRALQRVAELADVAGPAHGLQLRLGLGRQRAQRQALGGVQLLEEVPRQLRDVLAPRLEARHADRHHVQPVEELGAEPPGLHLAGEVARGRRDHPHVDPHRVRAADALERLVDQHPQDLRLGARRHVGHLVEEQDAGVGALEQPRLDAALGALAAEQHLLHLPRARSRPS